MARRHGGTDGRRVVWVSHLLAGSGTYGLVTLLSRPGVAAAIVQLGGAGAGGVATGLLPEGVSAVDGAPCSPSGTTTAPWPVAPTLASARATAAG